MRRRRFLKYGIVSAIFLMLGTVSAYFLSRMRRLPPKQVEVPTLEVRQMGSVPEITVDDWVLEVDGEVECPLHLGWFELLKLPKTVGLADLHCVDGWTRLDNAWEGVRFEEIMNLAKPTIKAKYVTIECYGEVHYTTQLGIKDLVSRGVLLAYVLDGRQLQSGHGAPVRLVVPDKYGYKSAKCVKRIKFTEIKELGFYESRGYSYTADPWTNDRLA